MFRTLKPFLILLAWLTLVSVACNALTGGSAPTEPPTPLGDASPTTAPAQPSEDSAPSPENTASPSSGGGDGSAPVTRLENISGALQTLDSYRLSIQISYRGTNADGQEQTGSMLMLQEYIRASGDQHIAVTNENSASPEQNGKFEFYQIGDTFYMLNPTDDTCFSYSGSEGMPTDTNPMDITEAFNNLESLELVERNVNVNGVAADHYKFDERALTPGSGIDKASGEVWLARDGNFVVKMTVEATGTMDLFQGSGTTSWTYELSQINQLSEIAIPESCKTQGSAEYPIPENALNQTILGDMVTFESPDSPAVLAAFYKEKMPEQGWTLLEEQDISMLQMLSFTKEGSGKVSITITGAEGSNTTVLIIKEP